ncbi:MAG: cytochrome b/b6 domain-containing protein [Emcibacteraceae bacterium]|nr:cytochrome b/b6 domain-containing protein [Emcibacteraceae bacterium]
MEENKDHVIRHNLFSRIFHWLMAVCILILIATGLLPVLGLKFEWVEPHWIAGLLLTLFVLMHVFKSLSIKKIKSMWISFTDIGEFIVGRGKVRGGKYSLEQKLMHHGIAFFSIVSLVTGWMLLLKIDTPFWQRDPFIFSADTWGLIYVFHDISTLLFVSSVMMHIYFSLRPEKAHYLRSMIKGWLSREEYNENHDPDRWSDR